MKPEQLLSSFDRDYLLSLLAENQIFTRSAGRQFLQATRRCFKIVGDAQPNQPAAVVRLKRSKVGIGMSASLEREVGLDSH